MLDGGAEVSAKPAKPFHHPEATGAFWTFNDHVPGPFIRARVGDTLEVHVTSRDDSGMPHNVDFHAVLPAPP
jgi:FtsP/CotA-like multicopper oxidase with cupredoxin domain